jgi:general secretion pathway protein D
VKATTKLYKIKLRHADPEDVYYQLLNGTSPDPDRKLRAMTKEARSATEVRFNPNDYLRSAVDAPVTPRNTQQPRGRTNEGSSDILLPGEAAGQGGFGGGPQGGGAGGAPGGGGGQQGGGGGAQGGGQLTPGGLIDASIDYISYDPNDNAIYIRATEEQWRQLQQYVDMFDIAPKQVTVKVQFVTTSSSSAKSLGFDWLYTRGTAAFGNIPGSFARSSDPIFLGWQSGNIQTRLRTFLQEGQGTTVSSPIVRTMNNQTATVQQGIQTTIFIPQTVLNQTTATTIYIPFPIFAQNNLSVRPRINDDGTVTMLLNPFIQQIGQIRRGPDGSAIPDIANQSISVAARVRSGDTIVLAGFTQKQDTGTSTKFPVLGDLPIVGQFFRSTSRDVSNSELLIFVTPVIEDSETGTGFGG